MKRAKKNPAPNVTRFVIDLDAPHHSGMTTPTPAEFTTKVDDLTIRKRRRTEPRVYWLVLFIGANPVLITSEQPISHEDEDYARCMVTEYEFERRKRYDAARYREAQR
jgi:hypothetical protein